MFVLFQISDDCAALVKENAALSAQVIESRKQLDMVNLYFLIHRHKWRLGGQVIVY